MTLTLLKYVLPVLAGYALFMLISGRFQPFRKPALLSARPSWLLGLWFGLSVAIVALLTMQMVNPLASTELQRAMPASAALLLFMLLPALPVYQWYRSLLAELQTMDWQNILNRTDFELDEFDYLQFPAEPVLAPNGMLSEASQNLAEDTGLRYELDETLVPSAEHIPSDEIYDAAFEREYDRLLKASNVVSETQGESFKYNADFDITYSDVELAQESTADLSSKFEAPPNKNPLVCSSSNTDTPDLHEPRQVCPAETEDYQAAFDHWHKRVIEHNEQQTESVLESAEYNNAFDKFYQSTLQVVLPVIDVTLEEDPVLEHDVIIAQALKNTELENARVEVMVATKLLTREKELKSEYELITHKAVQEKETESEIAIDKALSKVRQEYLLRQETEKHLRITRRALSQLEAEVRSSENRKSDELIALERELEEKIKIAAKAESALGREQKLRSQAERELITAKHSVLAARKDARKNTEARAKVLTTANKAIEFARHTVDARAKVEAQLQKQKEQIKIHQATISSLIDTLDREKSQHREEVSYLSKQLMQKELELEKKSIGTGNLTSRLVKKVARAKPVTRAKLTAG